VVQGLFGARVASGADFDGDGRLDVLAASRVWGGGVFSTGLVRGQARTRNSRPATRPGTPMSAEAQAAHTEAVRLFRLRQDQGFKAAAE
jgi:hypothetical protein